jgi:hypothetical protein
MTVSGSVSIVLAGGKRGARRRRYRVFASTDGFIGVLRPQDRDWWTFHGTTHVDKPEYYSYECGRRFRLVW